jgi:hypothetical protein
MLATCLAWPHALTLAQLAYKGLTWPLSHLAAISTFCRLGGLPPNQTPIDLGPTGGHPIKISTSGAPPIGLGSLGGCLAYKLPTCRQDDPLWALNR